MTADEIRELADADIEELIVQRQEELFRLRFRSATQPIENPQLMRQLRRDVARLKTILRERELAQTSGA